MCCTVGIWSIQIRPLLQCEPSSCPTAAPDIHFLWAEHCANLACTISLPLTWHLKKKKKKKNFKRIRCSLWSRSHPSRCGLHADSPDWKLPRDLSTRAPVGKVTLFTRLFIVTFSFLCCWWVLCSYFPVLFWRFLFFWRSLLTLHFLLIL